MDMLRSGFIKYSHKALWLICWLSVVSITQAQTTYLIDDGTIDTIDFAGTYHDLIIPNDPSFSYINLSARGGDGGTARIAESPIASCKAKGGEGASVSAIFKIGDAATELKPGSIIRFIPGGQGESDDATGFIGAGFARSGGGGGSAILYLEEGSTRGIFCLLQVVVVVPIRECLPSIV